jgi:hypothetical protein
VTQEAGLRAPGPTVAEFEQQYRETVLEARRELAQAEQAREVAEQSRDAWRRVAGLAEQPQPEQPQPEPQEPTPQQQPTPQAPPE